MENDRPFTLLKEERAG